ncbi:hypothetical protein EXIGLDRAFT_613065 [Exidia glandulosa HHB12029]|uniref:Peptide N-acetyl-beta-D-glucosaminyl asparaginase amidase A N-terminal domain-containing protein n=1 Tax=Exidia glandulosa HHB12029 TaxID=1314781 RepID=A0A165IGF8_EXIGL|nr:hypothetical protein EXIGLDRAFT_613065 [Exidia glandulosa HHB12029]
MIASPTAFILGLVLGASAQPLVDFQVSQPPVVPTGARTCDVQILQHNFDSFGNPAVIQYTPPTACGTPGSWAAVTLNYTGTSNGTQFDRLSAISFHNVEIWRTSTPEPTTAGIIWTACRQDVTKFIPLFAQPGTLILDLDNIVDPNQGLTGEYLITLTATFFASDRAHPAAKTADVIIPLSNLSPTRQNYVSVPPALNVTVDFPRNAVKAFVEIQASGNGNEEFWYFNTANEFLGDLPDGASFPNGPLREVRLLVDGQVAGAVLPWAIFFTGAIDPLVPIVSYPALDLVTYSIDLTPFIPVLTDGKDHIVSIDVISAEDDHAIDQNWFVSGNIQVFVDRSSKPTTGRIISYNAEPFPVTTTTGTAGDNGDVNVTVSGTRSLSVVSEIKAGSGATTLVKWSQNLSFTNTQSFLDDTLIQLVRQRSTGTSRSTHNGATVVSDVFDFPVDVDFVVAVDSTGQNVVAETVIVDHTFSRTLLPNPLVVQSTIHSHQRGNGSLFSVPGGRSGNGTNVNEFSFADVQGHTFTRQVASTNNNITSDRVGGTLAPRTPFKFVPQRPATLVPSAGLRAPGSLRRQTRFGA